jgi:hypothetical protein
MVRYKWKKQDNWVGIGHWKIVAGVVNVVAVDDAVG